MPGPIVVSYATGADRPRRSAVWVAVGISSTLIGGVMLLVHFLFLLLVLAGPFAPPDSPRPVDYGLTYEITFWVSGLVNGWLVASGLRALSARPEGRLGPRRMHLIYVVSQILVGLAWASLSVANSANNAQRYRDPLWMSDALWWLLMTASYPLILVPFLMFAPRPGNRPIQNRV